MEAEGVTFVEVDAEAFRTVSCPCLRRIWTGGAAKLRHHYGTVVAADNILPEAPWLGPLDSTERELKLVGLWKQINNWTERLIKGFLVLLLSGIVVLCFYQVITRFILVSCLCLDRRDRPFALCLGCFWRCCLSQAKAHYSRRRYQWCLSAS